MTNKDFHLMLLKNHWGVDLNNTTDWETGEPILYCHDNIMGVHLSIETKELERLATKYNKPRPTTLVGG